MFLSLCLRIDYDTSIQTARSLSDHLESKIRQTRLRLIKLQSRPKQLQSDLLKVERAELERIELTKKLSSLNSELEEIRLNKARSVKEEVKQTQEKKLVRTVQESILKKAQEDVKVSQEEVTRLETIIQGKISLRQNRPLRE